MSTVEAPQPAKGIQLAAIISGIAGFILFVFTPFMPVNQVQSEVSWPQGEVGSLTSPLISYAPVTWSADIPLRDVNKLNEGQSLVLGTLPTDSKDPTARGLFVRSTDSGVDVIVRNQVPLELSADELQKLPEDAVLSISSTSTETTAEVPGTKFQGTIDGDVRPQVTGFYTELDPTQVTTDGLHAITEVNSRFTSSPTLWKYLTMFGGIALLIISLICLHLMDTTDGRSSRRILPPNWYKPRIIDVTVAAVLGYWYIFGANTSDDGYLLTMARVSHDATYMANYYRWFGVPESPFGAPYYDLLGAMAQVSTASIWMRLPELIAALITWFIISREVLPRLGTQISTRAVAQWTAALSFLGFWIVYNNGLRPEPVIALGALLTWVSIERAIATSRLLPAAVGVIIATISLGAGPTGLMAVAALLAGLPSLIRVVQRRAPRKHTNDQGRKENNSRRRVAIAAMLAPFLASGTAILLAVFGDQTLAGVLEAIKVRGAKGPSLAWYSEWVRYQTLMQQTVDGSFTRRFAVLMMLTCLGIVLASVLRNGKVPGAAAGPSHRLMMVFFGTMFFMMFTPTKWTHHFGVYAGIGAALAALAAVAAAHMVAQSARNQTLFIGALLFLLAIALSSTNGWWYVSSYGIPWWDKSIQFKGIEASTAMLLIALMVLLAAAVQTLRNSSKEPHTGAETNTATPAPATSKIPMRSTSRLTRGIITAPIAVVSALVLAFSLLSLGKAFISQYPAYSIGLGNLRTFAGQQCGLAEDALVETNTNDSFLQPTSGDLGQSLTTDDSRNFKPNNIPTYIDSEGVDTSTQSAGSIAGSTEEDTNSGTTAGQASGLSGGFRWEEGINGSKARLPFGLDYTQVPVVGSYTEGLQYPAETTTQWYELPERSEDKPLLVVSAAGRIKHHDINGVLQDGQKLVVEYGVTENGKTKPLGEIEPIDIGPEPSWRNLRVPLDRIAPEANAVRIVVEDTSLDPDQWVAFTPPRVPTLSSLNDFVGDTPSLLDWSVALQFPCQTPFGHYAGVTNVPQFRISPDRPGKITLSPWQDYNGGGIMGVAEAINYSIEVPSYLRNDWQRDWGSLERYELRKNSLGKDPKEAKVDTELVTRSGLWTPGPMKTSDDD
ncbi:arabinosyltransferase domain-containing protein [Corynebacterium argentoratense]|uniref:arabinosyltransferase domain-containing protein n=1 Tax=Corynebacterium argentoratense TaxID=42817 RepID=UPI001F17B55C|nr:arabinosyltransferase domain-containing protein [Corynebacterium argentoratense]MCF1766051.1 arabinosyltransferase domain-containing protein [Corynebacterium argentoratense]